MGLHQASLLCKWTAYVSHTQPIGLFHIYFSAAKLWLWCMLLLPHAIISWTSRGRVKQKMQDQKVPTVYLPARFWNIEGSDSWPLLRIPDLYDASSWSVDDEKERQPGAMFARAVPRFLAAVVGGPLPMNVLHHLYPATLGVTVTCIRWKNIPIIPRLTKDLSCPFIPNHTHTCHAFVIFRISHQLA